MINDYDVEFNYHEGKANVVTDALSRKTNHSVASLTDLRELQRDIERLNLEIVYHEELESRLSALSIQPSSFEEILTNQVCDSLLEKTREQVKERKSEGFMIFEDGSVRYKG